MKIAAFQMIAATGDVGANLAKINAAAQEAAGAGARLLVVPELATTGYGAGDRFAELAEPPDGDQITQLRDLSSRTGLAIVGGFAERAADQVFNSAALVDRGALLAVYRKCQLYGDYERRLFAPGPDGPPIARIDGMQIGILICYDVEFPEMTRYLARAGAQLIAVPTAVPKSDCSDFVACNVVPVRAFESQVAIAYADHAGSDGAFAYAGRSCIVMPDGSDAARADADSQTLIVANYDPEAFHATRSADPYLSDLRTDISW
jgi:predicted amidohydrolase